MKRRSYEVRVIAGSLKGRKLRYPNDPGLRPTMQRTKGSVFESLGQLIPGAVFVDLYAGAGAMGIEALSRGASFAHFVENSRQTLRYLRQNTELCEPARFAIQATDAIEFLGRFSPPTGARVIVYADPPYAEDAGLLLEFYLKMDYPLPELLILEHRTQLELGVCGRLEVKKTKSYGQTTVTFLTAA